jgi:hypothetical protein
MKDIIHHAHINYVQNNAKKRRNRNKLSIETRVSMPEI